MLSEKENSLFERTKSGDKAAFEKLFNCYYPSLCNFAMGFVKERFKSEDIVIEAFQRIWDNRSKLTINSSIKSYLFTVVRNDALRLLKKEKNNTFLSIEEIGDHSAISMADSPTDDFTDLEIVLQKAYENLPERCRQIFTLHRIEGLSYKQIASLLEISVKTVENHMSKAIRQIVAHMEPYKIL